MPDDVKACLVKIIAEFGGFVKDQAQIHLEQLIKSRRIQIEAWS
jgi:sulfite reductase alpha subunit-like flavoprotein